MFTFFVLTAGNPAIRFRANLAPDYIFSHLAQGHYTTLGSFEVEHPNAKPTDEALWTFLQSAPPERWTGSFDVILVGEDGETFIAELDGPKGAVTHIGNIFSLLGLAEVQADDILSIKMNGSYVVAQSKVLRQATNLDLRSAAEIARGECYLSASPKTLVGFLVYASDMVADTNRRIRCRELADFCRVTMSSLVAGIEVNGEPILLPQDRVAAA